VSEPRLSGGEPGGDGGGRSTDEPPGTRLVSSGLRVAPNAEFSVLEPMANSSRLVLPTTIAPASRSLVTTVAS
jgi:hypothetical protein